MKEVYFNRYRNFRTIYTIFLTLLLGGVVLRKYRLLQRVPGDEEGLSKLISIGGGILKNFREEHTDVAVLLLFILPYLFISGFYMKKISEKGMIDPLTGIYLRGKIEEIIPVIKKDFQREWIMFYIDLDGLKQINDTMGHRAGDEHIVNFTRVIGDAIRREDYFLRMGGDEFLILLRGIEKEDRFRIVQRFYGLREEHSIKFSIGTVIFSGRSNFKKKDLEGLILKADHRMYRDKYSRRGLGSEYNF